MDDESPGGGGFVEQELSRLCRLLDGLCRRIQSVERRLAHTEECQQAQAVEIHDLRRQMPSGKLDEATARHEELSKGQSQLRDQVCALIDFLAQAHVGVPQRLEKGEKAPVVESAAGVLPLDLQLPMQQDPEQGERLRRIFSPPDGSPEQKRRPRPEMLDAELTEKGAEVPMGTAKSIGSQARPLSPAESTATPYGSQRKGGAERQVTDPRTSNSCRGTPSAIGPGPSQGWLASPGPSASSPAPQPVGMGYGAPAPQFLRAARYSSGTPPAGVASTTSPMKRRVSSIMHEPQSGSLRMQPFQAQVREVRRSQSVQAQAPVPVLMHTQGCRAQFNV